MTMKTIGAVAIIGSVFAAGVAVGQQSTSRREPQFENSEVQVWKSIVSPGTPLGLHRHDHGRALISLNGGVLNVVDEKGKVLDVYKLDGRQGDVARRRQAGHAACRRQSRQGAGGSDCRAVEERQADHEIVRRGGTFEVRRSAKREAEVPPA